MGKAFAAFQLMDMSHFTGRFSHYHAGKNAITLWHRSKPFITDSGCCDYDAPEFKGYFKNGEAHTSLLVDGMGDGIVQGTYDWIHYADLESDGWHNNTVTGVLTTDVPAWKGVRWERTLTADNDGIEITDRTFSDNSHQYEFIYPLHPDCAAEFSGNRIRLLNSGIELFIEFTSTNLLTVGARPAWWCDGSDIYPTKAIRVALSNKNAELKTRITAVS